MNIFMRSRPVISGRYLTKNCRSLKEKSKLLCTISNHTRFFHPLCGNGELSLCSSHALFSRRRTIDPYLIHYDGYYLMFCFVRNVSTTVARFEKEPLKPSSKVEVTVQDIKNKKEEVDVVSTPPKKPLMTRIKDELIHYYHGFRLLFIDIKISSKLVWRILNGHTLNRREHKLLMRTVGDIFRLVPFSVFIVVPFMEFLLPVFIKLFPGMLPSTFETAKDREAKIKQKLKVKIEMAKFLQQTLDDMSLIHKDRNSELAKEFKEWFRKVRTSGELVTNEEILKFSKLFQDELTLDSLTRSQLIALCRVLEVQTLGTTNMLRFQLRMKLRRLVADDKMIQKEGIDSLTLAELQQACRARGMRSYGLTEARLRSQLTQWLDLSLNKKVPPSLLLLSRALMLPESIRTEDQLKATISVLPDSLAKQAEVAIGETEGKIDNKVRIEVHKDEERKIKEERKEEQKKKEQEEREKKEALVDKAATISAEATPPLMDKAEIITEKVEKPLLGVQFEKKDEIGSKDLEVFKQALETISKDKKFLLEKEQIEDLKEEMADYQEDLQDLKKVIADVPKAEIKESKAAKRLFNRVNKMINNMDKILLELEDKGKKLKKDISVEIEKKDKLTDATAKEKMMGPIKKKEEELLHIDDLMLAIRKIKQVPDDSRLNLTRKLLQTMDDDHDGAVTVEDVLKVLEFIGKEDVKLTSKQWEELFELLEKEEILEVEEKIEKALQKQKEEKKKPGSSCKIEQGCLTAKSGGKAENPGSILEKEGGKEDPPVKPNKSSSSSNPTTKTQSNIPIPPSVTNMDPPKNKKML